MSLLEHMTPPPQSLEAEQGVIGALLLGADFDLVANEIESSDFFHPSHSVIYNAICAMVGSGLKVDILTLDVFLTSRKESDISGGFVYLAELAKNTPSVSNSVPYAKIVKEKSILRRIISTAGKIRELVQSECSVEEKIAQAQNLALSIENRTNEPDTYEIKDIFPEVIADIERRSERKEQDGLLTGYSFMDGMLKGLKGGHTHIIAGRPGTGKTTLAINIGEHIAQTVPVLIFSLEMPRKELVTRMISSLGRVPIDAIQDGKMDGNYDKLSIGAAKLKSLKVSICDRGGMTISRIRTIARFNKKIKGTGLIIIDYIGLVRTPNQKNSNRNLELGEVSRQLKEMAKELDIPIIVLAQLNRGIETRNEKTPNLADLRDSGEIEQDADTVTFLYRDKDSTGETEITIAKNRHGKTGKGQLFLRGEFSKFENIVGDYQGSQSKQSLADRY